MHINAPRPVKAISTTQRERARELLDSAEQILNTLREERLNLDEETRAAVCRALGEVLNANWKLSEQPIS